MNFWKRFIGDYRAKTGHLSLAEHGAYATMLDEYYSKEGPINPDTMALFRLCRAFDEAEQKAVLKVRDEFFRVGKDGRLHNDRADAQIEAERTFSAGQTRAARKRWGTDGKVRRVTRSQRLAHARALGTHTEEEWQALLTICAGVCCKCKSGEHIVKDHIRPIYRNGSDAIDNIQVLCTRCNSAKGPDETDYRPADWAERLPNACRTPSPTATATEKIEEKDKDLSGRAGPQRGLSTTDASPPTRPQNPDATFPLFWAQYPRREGKGRALTAWRKLKPDADTLQRILRAIPWQVRSGRLRPDSRDGRTLVPLPSSWINDRGWEDEPPQSRQGAHQGNGSAQPADPAAEARTRLRMACSNAWGEITTCAKLGTACALADPVATQALADMGGLEKLRGLPQTELADRGRRFSERYYRLSASPSEPAEAAG